MSSGSYLVWHVRFGAISRLFLYFVLVGFGCLSLFMGGVALAKQDNNLVYVVKFDTDIGIVSAKYLERSIAKARRSEAELVIIYLDTRGGSLDSTRKMVQAILDSEIPVVTYVGPSGAQAASAGTFIAAASGFLAMAPATNLGAAGVVGPDGQDLPETLSEKATEDAAAFIQSIAALRGRNPEALVLTVTESKSYSSLRAVELGIADSIEDNLNDLIRSLDGKKLPHSKGLKMIVINEPTVTQIGRTFLDRILEFLANPNLAFTLISLGSIGLMVELWNPGTWIPGILGVSMLVLGFTGIGNLDFSWTALIFLVLAVILFVVESQAPGTSFFGVAGVVLLVLGGIFLLDRFSGPDLQPVKTVSLWLPLVIGGITLILVLWLGYEVRLSHVPSYTTQTSTGTIVGKKGIVTAGMNPSGEVKVAGENWSAHSKIGGSIEEGMLIEVVERSGLVLEVILTKETETEI